MSSSTQLFSQRKLIAVIRGIRPSEAKVAAKSIVASGIDWLEVTTNSEDYLKSIEIMAETVPQAHVGVGTVLTEAQVVLAQKAGAQFIVSPNCSPNVIHKTKELNLISIPGVLTPTEAFTALEAGADVLKLFPVGWIGVQAIKDLRAVLPPQTMVFAVGGVNRHNYQDYLSAGYDGLGIGSELYRAGQSLTQLQTNAREIVTHYDQAQANLNRPNQAI